MDGLDEFSQDSSRISSTRTKYPFSELSPISTARTKHPYPSLPSKTRQSALSSEAEDDDDDDPPPIKTVVYVPNRSKAKGRFPVVSVHRKRDGRFVVVEQRPVHTYFSDRDTFYDDLRKLAEKEKKIRDSEVKFRSVKPPWKWATRGYKIERSFDRDYYEPHLPPIKNKYETEARIGSLRNIDHIPKGGKKKIPSFKVKWDVEAKVGSLDNVDYRRSIPRSYPNSQGSSGTFRSDLDTNSLKLPEIRPRYGVSAFSGGAFNSVHFNPESSVSTARSKKIEAKSKIGSLDNMNHVPGGGDVQIQHYPPEFKAEAKIGSLEKILHEPGGGDVSIIDFKPRWKSEAKIGSLENASHIPKKSDVKVPHFKEDFRRKAKARVGSMDNVEHTPRTSHPQIYNTKLEWKKESKISPMWKTKFQYVDPADPDYDEDAEIERRIRELMSK
ncbi:hypothetical protein FSP39_013841 [Pinctada imbricata]|uniref:Microtubule-associated protein n=1 Tax=Pinctada imbricata TaxID=66713 RepID=A0AA88YJS7_PINIB|nr:hypothetical protein FSP39_013841 [Pinctada imbricata]